MFVIRQKRFSAWMVEFHGTLDGAIEYCKSILKEDEVLVVWQEVMGDIVRMAEVHHGHVWVWRKESF